MALESLNRINAMHLELSGENADSRITDVKKNGVASYVLESLAKRTWNTLRYSTEMNVSQGEQTISDNNLLAIRLSGVAEIQVRKCSGKDEGRTGIDWEWFIGSDNLGWLRYAVQAKKLNSGTLRYDRLNHFVNGRRQLDILEEYAKATSAIPLYCLYNYVTGRRFDDYWHCRLACEPEQLGCTITPLEVIKQAVSIRGARSFKHIHINECTIPWRCLARCKHVRSAYQGVDRSLERCLGTFQVYRQIPPEVRSLFGAEQLSDAALYLPDLEFTPNRILIIWLDDIDEEVVGKPNDPNAIPQMPVIRRF